MEYNFDRVYELYIGTPTVESTVFTNTPKETSTRNPLQRFYTEIDEGKSVKISELQFRAKIRRSSKGSESTSDVTNFEILNMSDATKKYAEQEGALIILKAGYAGATELPVVYAGQIKSVRTSTSDTDIVTTIVAGDAYIPQKNSRITKYYPPEVSKADIIRDLGLSLTGVGEGVFATSTLESQFFNSGYSVSGKTVDVLKKLCKSLNHEVVIENNRVYVRPKDIDKASEDYNKLAVRALKLSTNQLKRGSGKMNDNTRDLSNEQTTKAGYRFLLFLDGRVRAASYVEVTDGDYQGVYKVVGVTHTLDYRGQEWTTEIETEAA